MTTQSALTSDFTPGELAYFNSRGADTSALDAEIAQEPAGDSPAADQQQPVGEQPRHETPASGDPQGSGNRPAAGAEDGADEGADGEEVVIVGKDGKPRSTNGRFVPHQALHKERERHKLTRQELEQTRERQARTDERLAVLNEILTKADQPEKPAAPVVEQPIDPQVDPIGALQQSLAKVKALEDQIKAQTQQQSARETDRALISAYQNDARRYVAEKPEFKDAYRFMIETRHRELEALGISEPGDRNEMIMAEERQLVAQALKQKRSPAQLLHNLAMARGFRAPEAAPAPAPKQDPVKKIEQIAQAQRQASPSLSGAGGIASEGLTAASLADMNEDEFASVVSKLGKSKMRQLLGG